MPDYPPDDRTIRELLRNARTIAVIGCSPKSGRTSHRIARAMQSRGYRIIPVHPSASTILGERVYPSLDEVPEAVDIVDVFRRPEHCVTHAREAVHKEARCLWLQLGIRNEEARAIATEAGLLCVMDACIKVEHDRLM